MGGTIGFFISGGTIVILSINFPCLRKILMNPFVLMAIVLSAAFIGNKIEENGKITIDDVKQSIKDGTGVTFYWFAIWIAIGLVCFAIIFFLKILNSMPTNY